MATPTKNLTYLPGFWGTMDAVALPVRPMVSRAASAAGAIRVAPALRWPVYQGHAQPMAQPAPSPGPLRVVCYTAVKMTLFWRGSQSLPLKGQRYPLSR